MNTRLLKTLKYFALVIFALTILTLNQREARADQVFIAGFSNGCFNCATAPATSGTQFSSLSSLIYTNSTFSGVTLGGALALNGVASPPAVQGVNNLGSFTLGNSLANFNGNSFTLMVTFTAPQGISGGNPPLLTATLTGNATVTANGGVIIDFSNTPLLFVFNDTNCEAGSPGTTCGLGSFSFSINDLELDPGQTASLTGQITGAVQRPQENTPAPEPATMILLGTGLAGLLLKRRATGGEAQD